MTSSDPDPEVVHFATPAEFREWLERHHATATELWVELRNRAHPERGMTWAQAVPEALCFGWIDSVSYKHGPLSRRQRWTPRRAGSTWSRVNIEIAERLIAEGRMWPAGLAAYQRRKDERSGVYSYEQDPLDFPPEYAASLAASPAATAFWQIATASYKKICVRWVLSAKQEATRQRRMSQLVEDSANGQIVKSQRYGTEPAWVTRAAEAAAQARG